MAHEPQIFHGDGPVRRTWASTIAAGLAAVIVVALLVGPLILRAMHGSNTDGAEASLLLFAVACVPVSVICVLFALIGIVRDRGTPRVGSILLLADAGVQIVFWLIGISSTQMQGLADDAYNASWAVVSLLVTVVACVFVFMPPRSVTHRRG